MAHFDNIRPSGRWANEMVPCAADYQRWDVTQSKFLNGDAGGSWAPTKPIIIGGAGVQFTTAGTLMTGGVTTKTGGRLIISAAAGDFPVLSPNRSRQIMVPILSAESFYDVGGAGGSLLEEEYVVPILGPTVFGLKLLQGTRLTIGIPRRYMHNGARIATMGIYFVVSQRPAAVPTSSPPSIFPQVMSRATAGQFAMGGGSPWAPPTWSPVLTVPVGQYIGPSNPSKWVGYYFKATAISGSGTTGLTEPNWPTTVGATVIDNPGANQITWTNVGRSGQYGVAAATVDTYYNNGEGQLLAVDFDGTTNGSGGTNIVDTTANRYAIVVGGLDSTMIVTAAFVAFDTITSLQFE